MSFIFSRTKFYSINFSKVLLIRVIKELYFHLKLLDSSQTSDIPNEIKSFGELVILNYAVLITALKMCWV